jgi:hypothetical protein
MAEPETPSTAEPGSMISSSLVVEEPTQLDSTISHEIDKDRRPPPPEPLTETESAQEVEASSLSHGESRETLGPDTSGPDASTREPTPAGIRNMVSESTECSSAKPLRLSASISMSDTDEEGCSEAVEEDALASSPSQDSIAAGRSNSRLGRSLGQSGASVFDSTIGPDVSVDTVDLEKIVEHVEVVDF